MGCQRRNLQRFLQRFSLSPTIRRNSASIRPLLGCESKPVRHILTNMKVDMPERYRKFKRTWGTYYAYDNHTGNSVSLKTRDKAEANKKVNAMNEAERQ